MFEFGPIDIGILLLFLVSLVWVGVDCHANKVPVMDSKQYSALAPFIWVVACILLWIVFFPFYLFKRVGTMKLRASGEEVILPERATFKAIHCPRCGVQMLLTKFVIGENTCPKCHGRFILKE